MEKIRALVLFSGGLDSMLAAATLKDQGVEVTALCFESNFFNAEKARESAKELGIDLRVEDINQAELDLVKNPPHGYGKNLNPCIDCHAMMIRIAGKIAQKENIDIVASGEVLGQRPFSQNRRALEQVEEISGVEVLRPLSAKLLPETKVEKERLVIRGKLHAIEGRGREEQMRLAKKYGLEEFPSPAGGCLLTDPEFSNRLMKMLDNWPECTVNDVELLKSGRVYWFSLVNKPKVLAIIGRHHEDNQKLESLAKAGDIMLELKQIMGPTGLLRFKNKDLRFKNKDINIEVPDKLSLSNLKLGEDKTIEEIIEQVATTTAYYATKARGTEQMLGIRII